MPRGRQGMSLQDCRGGFCLALPDLMAALQASVQESCNKKDRVAIKAPAPQTALGIPGINPIIPLGYGLLALIVGIVLHELLHGVVARSQNIGVKSLGILWLVVPVGAFVEQDDEQMMKAPRRHRDRVAAAGVLANFALTTLFFFSFQ